MKKITWLLAVLSLTASINIAWATLPQCQALVKQVSIDLKDTLLNKNINLKNNAKAVHAEVTQAIQESLDTKRIGRVILGEHWATLSDEQKERFGDAFKTRFIKAYAQGILSKAEYDFSIENKHTEKNSRFKVTLKIHSLKPSIVDYYLNKKDDAWKIYDVKLDGVSLLNAFQFAYQNKLAKSNIDQLLQDLEKTNP